MSHVTNSGQRMVDEQDVCPFQTEVSTRHVLLSICHPTQSRRWQSLKLDTAQAPWEGPGGQPLWEGLQRRVHDHVVRKFDCRSYSRFCDCLQTGQSLNKYISIMIDLMMSSEKVKVLVLSRVWLFATPQTTAHQDPLSMGFSRQEYWSGLSFPSPGDLPNPGIKPRSFASFSRGSSQFRDQTQVFCIAGRFFTIWVTREAPNVMMKCIRICKLHVGNISPDIFKI